MKNSKVNELEIFLQGELVDLCIPTADFALHSNWYKWFNDKSNNKYLEQGAIPNTKSKQLNFFENISDDRVVLIIVNKEKIPIGVISLSFINLDKKCCDIALVVSNDGDKKMKPFNSLEAMALMTTHAFETIGMLRVNAGQHINLAGWQCRMEILGYQLEGLHKKKFVKGNEVADSMSISASKENYELISKKRGGALWDGYKEMHRRIKAMPKKRYVDMLVQFYNNERDKYYKKIFTL